MLNLKDREEHLPNQLGVSRASIHRKGPMNAPAVVLADEPTGNLDSKITEIIDMLAVKSKVWADSDSYYMTKILHFRQE